MQVTDRRRISERVVAARKPFQFFTVPVPEPVGYGVDEFFDFAEGRLQEIPVEGSRRSLTWLSQQLDALLNRPDQSELIAQLLDEITSLRRELVDANQP